ncbi:MAG: FAD-dependent oxidoreductase [Deltaproteobacteria bacterium]|nr:FAD-dependent oxidoreductase [Deltaproteobacteria bacterium]
MGLRVTVPDDRYWKDQINCQAACPVHTDARGYVRAIAAGDDETAYRIARGPNPLASVCGRVCSAPCQEACRRGALDEPIYIRALKRFVTERFGIEAGPGRTLARPEQFQEPATPDADQDELAHLLQARSRGALPPPERTRVAIIGAGPAGLACAHDLALMGARPVLLEMEPKPAGMMYTGIPEFRLPREVLDAEIRAIQDLGVEIRCGKAVGRDVSFDDLLRDFDAVVIAVGAKRSRSLGIPGEDAEGVLGGVEFLRQVAFGEPPPLGKRVVVIGGGFTALDCSRSSLRVGVDSVVNVLYRRTRDEMPVTEEELEEAREEGVNFQYLVTPVAIEKDEQGRVRGVRLVENRLGPPDETGRRRPEPIPGSERVEPCDTVILAIGQRTDLDFVDPERHGVRFTDWGLLEIDEDTLATTAPGVFVAGDAALGAANIVTAVASGKKAARSVYAYLSGREITPRLVERHRELPGFRREPGYEALPRTPVPLEEVQKRLSSPGRLVERGYDEALARREASRCLDCGVNTIFDSERCVLCGGCADVCPMGCLKLVPLADLDLDDEQQRLAREVLGEGWEHASAIIKDEDLCIRCALCAQRCPNAAITMERVEFQEVWP